MINRVEGLHLQRETLDRLDVELDDWVLDDDFIVPPLTDMVVEACDRLGLPLTLASQWEDLARPTETFDPATATPQVPVADTG